MRLIAVLLLLCVPHAAAQWTDAAGDVEIQHPGGASADENFQHVDLVALDVEETAGAFRFWVGLDDLGSPSDDFHTTASTIRVPWSIDGREYVLVAGRGGAAVVYHYATLYAEGERVWWSNTFEEDVIVVDTENARIGLDIDRRSLGSPWRGQGLEIGTIESHTYPAQGVLPMSHPGDTAVAARDAMEAGRHVVKWGVAPDGVLVRVAEPVRQTNGEAASHLFVLNATSPEGGTFAVILDDVPDTWKIDAPQAILLEPGEVHDLPIVVTVPFAHSHGTTDAATVRLEDPAGSGGVAIGIHALDIPQPAGHHDDLFLHSRTVSQGLSRTMEGVVAGYSRTPLFMSPLEEDPAATGESIPASVRYDGTDTVLWWAGELQPGWRIPLDIQPGGQGSFRAEIAPAPGGVAGTLQVRLLARGIDGAGPTHVQHPYQNDPTLVLLEGRTAVELSSRGQVEVTLEVAEGVDRVDVPPHGQLILEVLLHSNVPAGPLAPTLPSLLPGAVARLPLTDVDMVGEAPIPEAIRLLPAQRQANPGDTLVWVIDGPGEDWQPAGAWADSSSVVEGHLVVDVPADSVAGQRVRVFAVGTGGVAVAIVEVVEDAVADDSAWADELLGSGNHAPAPAAILLMACAWMAWIRRR